MRRSILASLPILLATAPMTTIAQAPGTLALSDTEKAELLSRNTEASVDDARIARPDDIAPHRAIHGEVGALVGSHGTRSVFGTAAIPIGDTAGATLSFERSRYGIPR